MQLLTPIVPDPSAPLARANPVAKLGAALVIMVALFASLDGVTAAIVLAGLLALLPASGLGPRALLGRAWLVGVTAISIGVFNVLFAADQIGPIVIEAGPLRIGAETLA
ncbi:MAG TPA: energy-coupling factor transporter transmembrane protein EcfT, partial [Candidatus Limnocylindria bacterium]